MQLYYVYLQNNDHRLLAYLADPEDIKEILKQKPHIGDLDYIEVIEISDMLTLQTDIELIEKKILFLETEIAALEFSLIGLSSVNELYFSPNREDSEAIVRVLIQEKLTELMILRGNLSSIVSKNAVHTANLITKNKGGDNA